MDAEPLIEGEDYYIQADGRWVFTAAFLLKRGFCCKSGCRHCPYGFVKQEKEEKGEETHDRRRTPTNTKKA